MPVDYSLLARFRESSRRHAAARAALRPEQRDDPRPEVQDLNERWVGVVARAREHQAILERPVPEFLIDR